jgi:hypothetical protein
MILPNPFPAAATTSVTVKTTLTTAPSYKFKRAGTAGTLIAVVLDESGSMQSCWDSTIAGFNEYVAGQRAAVATAGAAYMTLVKFDAPHIKTVFADRPIEAVPQLNKDLYRPNGGTNLLDAIGETIQQVNAALERKKKRDRPGVIIVITTDGAENASNRFNNDQIKAMVSAAEAADWSFVFMGANIDSFAVGSTFGMSASNTVNYSTANMAGTMSALSATTTRMRSAKMSGMDTQAVYASAMFTADEKKSMEGK